ncbi:hypothetical protein J8L85_00060 [Maribacter sp. MMG018]|uniref:hypothetical protein n=1 Tax=Maribacter sp. MMG018 TaxID=2822688 RepID=UPI001B38137F|nr:hypothetical protein [Maribacter sp. MMG018]MBQ4912807.1 hypothetical protein [Maribacter sp. MMG018]
MKFKIVFSILLLVIIIGGYFIFNSIRGDILNKKDLGWQPYMVGDELVFESNFGQIDKIIVTEIYKSELPAIPFSIIPKEVIEVRIQRKLIKLPKNKDDSYNKYDYNEKGIHNTSTILLTLDANDYFGGKKYEKSLEYWVPLGVSKQKIKDLNALSEKNREIVLKEKNKYYTTYEIINKQYGIISYGSNDKNWNLKKFMRNGKNIYKKTMANTL